MVDWIWSLKTALKITPACEENESYFENFETILYFIFTIGDITSRFD